MAAKVQSEFALLGYMNAAGNYVATPFRLAYEFGGCFLFDEMDASAAAALTAFNAALANGHCPFPDGLIKRHPDFIAIGAGNTMGSGANRMYVGRTQIDAATLDRFAFLNIEYDLALERALTPNQQWCSYVQAIRNEVEARNIRHIVSPRASINGSAMIAEGETWQEAANAIVFKGLDAETVQRLNAAVPMATYETEK
jgi:MoxR-like ATPase